MNAGRTVLAQLLAGLDRTEWERCERRHGLGRRSAAFSSYDHFVTMVFAQLTYRQSLRDIEACLNALPERRYHAGIRGRVTRSNLAYANEHRSHLVFAAAADVLMRRIRRLAPPIAAAAPWESEVFAFDATLVDLSLALCPWAHRQQSKAAIRLNVLLNTELEVPEFASITAGNTHEVHALEQLPLKPGAFYVLDRGYVDFERLHRLHRGGVWFVVRARSNLRFRVTGSRRVDQAAGLRCDQTIMLSRRASRCRLPGTAEAYPASPDRSGNTFVLLTNHPELAADLVPQLYRRRWQVELFFRWIKQHLRLRWFYSTSPNGIRVQIWSALCAHLLVAIAKERLAPSASLYQILQIASVCIWEKVPLAELLAKQPAMPGDTAIPNQLELRYL
jgi:hypothetical protein